MKSSLKQVVSENTSKYANILTNLGFTAWNWAEDQIWKCIALGVSAYGWQLTADLLWLAANGSGNTYTREDGSYAAELLKNDLELNKYIRDLIGLYGKSQNKEHINITGESFEIPLNNGDLGAALHNIKLDIDAYRNQDNSWTATVKVSDTFDFTEFKNPFKQGTILKGLLWAANDIAYFDTEWGLLDSVDIDLPMKEIIDLRR